MVSVRDVKGAAGGSSTGARKAKLAFDEAGVGPLAGTAFVGAASETAFNGMPTGVTDPEAAKQWHLGRLGGIEQVWADYTGRGVRVGVYDSGVQYAHWDLNDNYDASLHIVLDGKTYDGDHRPASGPHGTSVAGIIAAERNGQGTVGVAYDARLTGVNIFDPYSGGGRDPGIFVNAPSDLFFRAMNQAAKFDVVNHSWGSNSTFFDASSSRTVAGTFSYGQAEALRYAAENGRGGLGTSSVIATGNSNVDSQGDAWNSDRHGIAVSAYRQIDSYASSYSSRGAHVLVAAPSSDYESIAGTGVVTTDLLGREGYNIKGDAAGIRDYTDQFGGTSAATPVVSGVVALMLDANEGLGWRDVKNILAASSTAPRGFSAPPGGYQGSFFTRLNESQFKLAGQDADWNGGAMHYSTDYGYGAVNAHAAVRMSEVWSLFGQAKTSGNEAEITTGVLPVGLTSTANNPVNATKTHTDFISAPTRFTFEMGDNIDLEHVDISITFATYSRFNNNTFYYGPSGTQFKLIAPDGTQGFVDTTGATNAWREADNSFTFGFSGFRGVESEGTWAFEFLEPYRNYFTQVKTLQMTGWGSAITSDDVYTYTDEFQQMAALTGEGDRRTLSDADGGIDWINAAAVTSDIDLSLAEGATTFFGADAAFAVARGSLIEHAVTGDGDDRLFGNALDNKLYGMRGDDWLNGGAGNDTLYGGQGSDVFAFDTAGLSGRDRVLDWSMGDRIATSKQLRGEDQNGVVTLGSAALLLLDGNTRGDTAELVGQGGATLKVLGKSDGYWWYGFLTEGDESAVDGRVSELALNQTGRPAGTGLAAGLDLAGLATESLGTGPLAEAVTARDSAFFLYDTMGDAMASGVQIAA